MASLLTERIAALRKERGFTQEQLGQMVGVSAQAVSKWEKGGAPDVDLLPAVADALGVSIDSLFGRVEEDLDLKAAVRRWMLTFPEEQRMDRLCHFIWSVMGALSARNMGEAADWDHYVDHCRQDPVEAEGRTYRMLERTRVMLESGLLLGVRARDMSYLAIFPEPEAGWEPFLERNDLYRRLFALLARPRCLELLEYLHSKPSRFGRNFTTGALVKQTGFDAAEAESLLEALAEMNILMVTELETEEGVVNAYCMYETECLVPLLSLACYFASGGGITNGQSRRTAPVLRGEKWKEEEN